VRHTITRFSSLLGFMVASLLLLWTALLLALKRSDQHTTRREDAIDREWVCLVHVRIERGANLSLAGPVLTFNAQWVTSDFPLLIRTPRKHERYWPLLLPGVIPVSYSRIAWSRK
jgi:hypothetical protein